MSIVLSPRMAQSRAVPAPVAPPPITITSYSLQGVVPAPGLRESSARSARARQSLSVCVFFMCFRFVLYDYNNPPAAVVYHS